MVETIVAEEAPVSAPAAQPETAGLASIEEPAPAAG